MTNPSANACRFVLLHHQTTPRFSNETGRGDHFDLMIESPQQELLVSWAFEVNPFAMTERSGVPRGSSAVYLGKQVASHRKEYLTYEGPVSGDRGTVKRLVAGACDWLEHNEIQSVLMLQWKLHQCQVTLAPLNGDLVQMTIVDV